MEKIDALPAEIVQLLERLANGDLSGDEAKAQLAAQLRGVDELGFARLDTDRARRTGVAEVIFGAGKTPAQLKALLGRCLERHGRALATRVSREQVEVARSAYPELTHDPIGRLLLSAPPTPTLPAVGVLSAGTSDQPVAEEAASVLAFLGHRVERLYDYD